MTLPEREREKDQSTWRPSSPAEAAGTCSPLRLLAVALCWKGFTLHPGARSVGLHTLRGGAPGLPRSVPRPSQRIRIRLPTGGLMGRTPSSGLPCLAFPLPYFCSLGPPAGLWEPSQENQSSHTGPSRAPRPPRPLAGDLCLAFSPRLGPSLSTSLKSPAAARPLCNSSLSALCRFL